MKTFDRKDIYSWANCEEAKKYIGKQGFIGASLGEISERLKKGGVVILQDVEDTGINCFYFEIGIFKDCSSGLFLPLDKVKEVEEEKKWRAFKISELMALGITLRFRRKNKEKEKGELYDGILTGTLQKAPNETIVTIGCYNGTLSDLFKNYELYNFNTRKWQPFGVEE